MYIYIYIHVYMVMTVGRFMIYRFIHIREFHCGHGRRSKMGVIFSDPLSPMRSLILISSLECIFQDFNTESRNSYLQFIYKKHVYSRNSKEIVVETDFERT